MQKQEKELLKELKKLQNDYLEGKIGFNLLNKETFRICALIKSKEAKKRASQFLAETYLREVEKWKKVVKAIEEGTVNFEKEKKE